MSDYHKGSWYVTDKFRQDRKLRQDDRRIETIRRVSRYVFAIVWPLFMLFMITSVSYVTFRWAFR